MTQRVVPDPSSFTRLISVGRQLRKLQTNCYNLVATSKAARLLRTTRVRVISVGIGGVDELRFTVEPFDEDVRRDLADTGKRTHAMVHETELE